jgi:hypothetical protein
MLKGHGTNNHNKPKKNPINRNKRGIESSNCQTLGNKKYNKRNTKVLELGGHPNPSTNKNKCEKNESIVLLGSYSILEHETCINYPNLWIENQLHIRTIYPLFILKKYQQVI